MYKKVDQLLKALQKARETMSWKEIKAKVKDKRIKKIDEAKGEVTVEL